MTPRSRLQAQRLRAQRLKARVQSAGLAVWALLWSAGPVLLLVLAAMGAAYWWLNPTPPKRVVLATGPGQSAYDTFGQQYAKALALNGIELGLRPTEGSSDNLALLRAGEVDLAFVQGGSDTLTDDDRDQLVSLGSLFVEPVWVFYREAVALDRLERRHLDSLAQLKGWKINIGHEGSGVTNVMRRLFNANGIDPRTQEEMKVLDKPPPVEAPPPPYVPPPEVVPQAPAPSTARSRCAR